MIRTYNVNHTIAAVQAGLKVRKPGLYQAVRESLEVKIPELREQVKTCSQLDKVFGVDTVQYEMDELEKLQDKARRLSC